MLDLDMSFAMINGKKGLDPLLELAEGPEPLLPLYVMPEHHEMKTATYFSKKGYDVVFLRPSNMKGTHSPDILMNGLEWEIKSPVGKSKRTIEKIVRRASFQSKRDGSRTVPAVLGIISLIEAVERKDKTFCIGGERKEKMLSVWQHQKQ